MVAPHLRLGRSVLAISGVSLIAHGHSVGGSGTF